MCFLLLTCTGCLVGPGYKRPDLATLVPVENQWAEDKSLVWKAADPAVAIAPKSDWWQEVFADPQLDVLIAELAAENLSLEAAYHRIGRAYASLRLARSDLYPDLTANLSFLRQQFSDGRSFFPGAYESFYQNIFSLSYEFDIWGRIRRGIEAEQAGFLGNIADYANLDLSLKAQLVNTYFLYRALKKEVLVINSTIKTRRQNADLVKNQLEAGEATQLDYARAMGELTEAQAGRELVSQQLIAANNAIAVLLGKNAVDFQVKTTALEDLPALPPKILPSELLERRPDIARAEQRLIAANAQIGVAEAAFYPSFNLAATFGYLSQHFGNLYESSTRTWSVGPGFDLPIFQGGANLANLSAAEQNFLTEAAEYKATVLQAFTEVKTAVDSIARNNERVLKLEQTVAHYRQASDLARDRFVAGIVSFFNVVDAQSRQLNFERELAQARGRSYELTVDLVKALGGGYSPLLNAELLKRPSITKTADSAGSLTAEADSIRP